jgi:thiol-disulfide isomerase/thioredoxin
MNAAPLRPELRQIAPGIGANTEDPKKVLQSADDAVRAVRSVSYDAVYEGMGASTTRSPISTGRVRISRLPADDPLIAKMAIEGQFIAAGTDQPQTFHAAFDGHTIRRLRSQDSTLVEKPIDDPKERSLGTVTGFMGAGPYYLLMFEYAGGAGQDRAFASKAGSPVVEYEGRTSVNGILCHVVYLEYPVGSDRRLLRERWFIGIKDRLARRVERVSIDDKGRYGAYVLTLSNVRVNPQLSELAFNIKLPSGYRLKPYVPAAPPAMLAVGDAAPDWKLKDAQGTTHALADYRGKVLVLDFWATWCGPCVRAMPDLQKLHEKYRARGVEVIGINAWEQSNAAAYMKEKGYTYGLLLNGETVADAYRAGTLPTIYVLGPDGRVVYGDAGGDAEKLSKVTAAIEQILRQ